MAQNEFPITKEEFGLWLAGQEQWQVCDRCPLELSVFAIKKIVIGVGLTEWADSLMNGGKLPDWAYKVRELADKRRINGKWVLNPDIIKVTLT